MIIEFIFTSTPNDTIGHHHCFPSIRSFDLSFSWDFNFKVIELRGPLLQTGEDHIKDY